ncbi:MAG: hypothetical protein IJC26_08885 [Clostridia bacterium]|nr:hypothetical protein [Clostridia bacterium]
MKSSLIKYLVMAGLCILMAGIGFGIGFFLFPKKPAPPPEPVTVPDVVTTAEEIQSVEPTPAEPEQKGEAMSKTPLMKGIDVSKWQGKPDWKKIAAEGVEFAMIRIGYHGTKGPLGEDVSAAYNLKNADENGILTGVYFYSLAKNEKEAEEEAMWVLERVGKYAISLPIVIDYEMMENDVATSASQRTDIALTFLRTVKEAGYEGMLYAPIDELNDPVLWEKDRIFSEFKVWGADYETAATLQHPDGETDYAMWQYSNTGRVSGISGNVDLDFAYFTARRSDPKKP